MKMKVFNRNLTRTDIEKILSDALKERGVEFWTSYNKKTTESTFLIKTMGSYTHVTFDVDLDPDDEEGYKKLIYGN